MSEYRFKGSPPDFDCVICQRHIDNRFPGAVQSWSHPPVCRYCENHWGDRVPPAGAFKDRRIARQISALATALDSEARHHHFRRYGYGAERL